LNCDIRIAWDGTDIQICHEPSLNFYDAIRTNNEQQKDDVVFWGRCAYLREADFDATRKASAIDGVDRHLCVCVHQAPRIVVNHKRERASVVIAVDDGQWNWSWSWLIVANVKRQAVASVLYVGECATNDLRVDDCISQADRSYAIFCGEHKIPVSLLLIDEFASNARIVESAYLRD